MSLASIFVPVLLEHGLNIVAPVVGAAALWIGAKIAQKTNVDITAQLNALFNAVLARAAEDAVRRYGSTGAADAAVAAVIQSVRKTNPDLVKKLALEKAPDVFAKVAARAVDAARDRKGN